MLHTPEVERGEKDVAHTSHAITAALEVNAARAAEMRGWSSIQNATGSRRLTVCQNEFNPATL